MSSPKPKRPGSKHHDSFFHKIHKRHDERHHAGNLRGHHEGQQPLLREEHPDSTSEVEAQSAEPSPGIVKRYTTAVTQASSSAKDAVTATFRQTLESTKQSVSTAAGGIANTNAGGIVKFGASRVGKLLLSNPIRLLSVACVTLLLLATGEAVDIYMHHPLPQSKANVCLTPACVNAASTILDRLHPAYQHINPCDNFEQYVCDGFRLNHELREDQGSMFTGTLVEEELYVTLRRIIEQDDSEIKREDMTVFRKVKDAYTACTDEDRIKEYGIKPLKGIVDGIRSHFTTDEHVLRKSSTFRTISNLATAEANSLTAPLSDMARLSIDNFLSFSIGADDQQPDVQLISVRSPKSVGLPAVQYYQKKDITTAYAEAMEKPLSHFLDLPRNSSTKFSRRGLHVTAKDLARGIVQLEAKIANVLPSDSNLKDTSTYNRIAVYELDKLFPQFSISTIVHSMAPRNYKGKYVIIPSLSYIKLLSKLIATTPEDILQAYLIWKTIQAFAHEVEDESLAAWKNLLKTLSGQPKNAKHERWRTCVANVNADFGWILSKFYVEQQFSQQAKAYGDQIISDVTKTIGQIISSSAWMAQDDRQKALSKLHNMNSKVGFPNKSPDISNPATLEAFYRMVLVQNNTYLENRVQSTRAKVSRQWSKLGQPTDKNEWAIVSTTVDAYYSPSSNDFVLPAAIMRKPMLYNSDVPSSLSYGAFGALVGHEITHAFDYVGMQYNDHGTSAPWWSNTTYAAFKGKAKCFAEQYSGFTVNGPNDKLSINGNLTLDESIADAGGLHGAYAAWAQREASRPSQSLPGLEMFDQKQLFWLSYGNWWCSKATAQALEQKILVNPHLPESIRIRGAVANSQQFREAFNCPLKEPTCRLW